MNKRTKIQVASPIFIGNENKYLTECIESGWISSNGRFIKAFEEQFAEFCGTKHAITCSNGTAALHLALLVYGIGIGDEVIVPTLTYVASANAVTYCGAHPVFVDSEANTWNINPELIEAKITDKTKGIIVVHLYGHPVDMDAVNTIARKHNLVVIEDAAEAHGALYKGKIAGSLGDIATFSFYGNKIITTGEGGIVVTNDDEVAAKLRLLKGQGMSPTQRYWFPIVGYNYRMTNMQAAIGLAQIENIDWHLSKRKEVSRLYYQYLAPLSNYIELPVQEDWASHSFWMYTILLKSTVKMTRDEFMDALDNQGVETRPIFYPMHILPIYQEDTNSYPVANDVAARGFNLPTHGLLKEEDIAFIAKQIENICFKLSI
ncbi:DegT/DnrJ/EryC1/StrS family aminotransferase [Nostoc commune]|uniref:DegT/DnrJ/EryC1/StrS family aminotransferase n=1 Tax=Nostoc commune TaxID=1178 RepID=UPI0018C63FE2|nr:DegT/DnrJ/EryC1/StrS family aminotransferase [Nostoc commune]MBG1260435.1 DegT/DnrJ/EryC1/StrS family aminotransferase [Nostoc commune BAE]